MFDVCADVVWCCCCCCRATVVVRAEARREVGVLVPRDSSALHSPAPQHRRNRTAFRCNS